MSPIFVRPVREQLEHDRLIRFLQGKYKRKFEAAINLGDERQVPVKIGPAAFYPDLVLMAGRKLAGVVEVETAESVNNLEAMAQWVPFSRARVPFHLYVPVPGYDAARRLCAANGARPAEIWTYRGTSDGFDMVRIFHDPAAAAAKPVATEPASGAARTAKAPARKAGAKTKPKAAKARPKPPAKAKGKTKPRKPAGKAKPARRK